ncbi:hypothetical protein EON65_22715 [archaeon]|nr:MAG: hypothetical protein EON65_22715 [archaeon]
MGKQVSFDIIAKQLHGAAEKLFQGQDVKFGISLVAAFLTSIIACVASQPGDMILTATYKGGHGGHHGDASTTSDSPSGFLPIIGHIYRQHGLGGFYIGLQARLAHVASIITSQLVMYDIIKMALGLPITGSH